MPTYHTHKTHQGYIPNVVPGVGEGISGGQLQCPLEASDRHVILLRVETAESEIVEEFSIIHTHLKQSSARDKYQLPNQ